LVRAAPIVIPVTHRVKGYTRFVGKYVTGRILTGSYYYFGIVG